MHQSSLKKMYWFKETYLENNNKLPLKILDLGSMDVNGSYKECFKNSQWSYIGLDLAIGKNVDIVLKNPYVWKEIKTASFDVLISGQAFEHIEYFWMVMFEIARVLKQNGLCCIIAPSSGPEHRYPVDCWRFYPDGFSALARMVDFEILELRTEWGVNSEYTDCSNNWHDTIMVARKKYPKGLKRLNQFFRQAFLKFVFHH